MPYSPFDRLYPEVAQRETRNIAFLGSAPNKPQGSYILHEMYCDEAGCDCRRVMLYVTSMEDGGLEAVIAFGWEDEDFYRRWYGQDDPQIAAVMKGPNLNLGSPTTKHSEELLSTIADTVLSEPSYVERLQRHYEMFRGKIDAPPEPVRNVGRKIGRNEPCPCSSGRKWKVCCGNSANMN
jgi:hypothetical protein